MADTGTKYRSNRQQSQADPSLSFKTERISPKPPRRTHHKHKKQSEQSAPYLLALQQPSTKPAQDSQLRLLLANNELSRLRLLLAQSSKLNQQKQKTHSALKEQLAQLRESLLVQRKMGSKLSDTIEQKQLMLQHLRGRLERGQFREEAKEGQLMSFSGCLESRTERRDEFQNQSYERRMKQFINSIGRFSDEEESISLGRGCRRSTLQEDMRRL